MESQNERTPPEQPRPAEEPTAPALKKRRFRIVKLEERVAPSRGGKGTHNCGNSSATDTIGSASIY